MEDVLLLLLLLLLLSFKSLSLSVVVVVESDYYVKIDEGKELDEGDIDKLFQTPQYYTTSE